MANRNEHIIDETLKSIDGMKRAGASPFLYGRIMERMKQQLPAPVYYTGKVILRFALAVMLVASLNVISVRVLKKQTKPQPLNEEMELQRMAQEYFGFENTNGYIY
ncbi:MAG: hypothetical protein V4590_12570 [Bacteroidota bacterium]